MTATPPPTLKLHVDGDALASNWRALDRLSGGARAGAAVKANCYGLGVDRCVPTLRDAGCREFFVAHWSEVEAVLAHVPADQLSVLHGPVRSEDVEYARATGVLPVINSLHQARLWVEGGGGPCHLMVDTGINRLGIAPAQLSEPFIRALEVRTLLSHLACADEDSAMNDRQRELFRSVMPLVAHREPSLANSAGIALGPEFHFGITRPGLSLYGGLPRSELDGEIRQVAYPQAAIIQKRTLSSGDSVGYNATFKTSAALPTAVVSLGYADGFLRAWGESALRYGDATLPILGKVSMDMVVVDLSSSPDLREGDWIDLPYALPDAAQQTGLSQYELLTILGRRFGS